MSKVQKVKKLSGKLCGTINDLDALIEDGEYSDALDLIVESKELLNNLEEKLEDLYDSYFC